MKAGVVIPVGPNRHDNVQRALEHLSIQTVAPEIVVLVCDGPESHIDPESLKNFPMRMAVLDTEKHEPGLPQPRNVGADLLMKINGGGNEQFESVEEITHVWFLDSDIIMGPDCLEHYHKAMESNGEPRVLVGPYDWMPPGQVEPMPELHNDPRWVSFKDAYPWDVERENLSAGLACFSGNLVWPLDLFRKVGGFWDEMHHARCEDGELGLRAVAMGIGVSFVSEARGWHIHHDFDVDVVTRKNARDVPMINARHPWKELGEGGEELFVVDEDGKRFNVRCVCGEEFNSALIWEHREHCTANRQEKA
jgi:GT2 family glycosyltransferase